MNHIKSNALLAIVCFLMFIFSCQKNRKVTPEKTYTNRVLQDSTYRVGKWISLKDSVTQQNFVPDTLWFLSSSSCYYCFGGQPCQSWHYYFDTVFYNINFIAPDAIYPSRLDTVQWQCYTTNDTFQILWFSATSSQKLVNYVKLR
jgi:hypothetical protein